MRRHGASFSHAVQVGLAASVAVAIGVGVAQSFGDRAPGPPLDSTLRELRARAAELATLVDEQRADRLTDAFVRSHVARWQRVTRNVSADLEREAAGDVTGAAAHGQRIARALLSIGERVRNGGAAGTARDAATQAATEADALVAEHARRSSR